MSKTKAIGHIKSKIKREFYVQLDRELLKDKRLKPASKILYGLFVSMSATMEAIYPSYSWIASEIGYEYNGKHKIGTPSYERAMKKYVKSIMQPLVELGLIKQTNNTGEKCDYEVHDYTPNREQKSSHHREQKSSHHREQKSSPSNKEYSDKERGVYTPPPNDDFTLVKNKLTSIDYLFGVMSPHVQSPIIEFILQLDEETRDEYLDFLQQHHKARITDPKFVTEWGITKYRQSQEQDSHYRNLIESTAN
jgi:hypothetical protein